MTNKKLSRQLVLLLTVCLAVSSFAFGALASDNGGNISSSEAVESHAFTVAFKSEQLPDDYRELVQRAGGTVTYEVPQIGVIEATTAHPTTFIKEMLKDRHVLSIGPSTDVQIDLPEVDVDEATSESSLAPVPADEPIWGTGWQWDIEQVTNNGASHDISTASRKDVVVAVIDTGFDFNHPDLMDHVDLEGSKTFVPGTTDSWDAHSHGTHVAGTIGADGRIKGVAPGVTLRSYRVFNTGSAQQIWITDAIVAAADDGVDVINMSLGGIRGVGQWWYVDPETGERIRLGNDAADMVAYNRAVRYAIDRNVTVVASAGNAGLDLSNPTNTTAYINALYANSPFEFKGAGSYVPAQIPGVITVSATGGGLDTENRLAFYSNYGNGAINLSAPGGDLGPTYDPTDPSTRTPDAYKYLVLSTVPTYEKGVWRHSALAANTFGDIGYSWKGGTSMAAPQVSGSAAAYIAHVLETTGKKPSPSQVQTHLQQTAEDAGKVGYDKDYGHGIVNAYRALINSKK